jgi:hypothetical protein
MSNGEEQRPDGPWTDPREQRLRALRALASAQTGDTPVGENAQPDVRIEPIRTPLPPRRRRRLPLWSLGGVVLLLVAVVAGVIRHSLPRPKPTTQRPLPTAVQFIPGEDHLYCASDAAWSHDDQYVAVLGYDNPVGCTTERTLLGTPGLSSDTAIGVVNVYNAASGKLVKQIQLTAPIVKAITLPQPVVSFENTLPGPLAASTTLEVSFQHVLWLPDSHQLAVTFLTFIPSGPPASGPGLPSWPGAYAEGVEISDVSSVTRVLMQSVGQSVGRPAVPPMLVWDLSTGSAHAGTLPASGAYRWAAGGSLTSAAASDAAVPVGNPAGGSTFSLWQPGQISLYQFGPNETPAYVWTTQFAARSPDGRHLLADATVARYLRMPAMPSDSTLRQLQGFQGPGLGQIDLSRPLALRDSGLRAALANLFAGGASPLTLLASTLAWRSDARLLAVQTMDSRHQGDPAAYRVLLYDCQTGQQVAVLQPKSDGVVPGNGNDFNVLLRWSADGSRLLLVDDLLDASTIWEPAALPHV